MRRMQPDSGHRRHLGPLPEDVDNAVAYLAGPEANHVTGINLPVAGGVPFGI